MIGNNDWFDYLDYREYIAHSWGTWDKRNVKYIDKIQTGSGKYRYIYPDDRKSNNERRRVPTYNDKYQREAERRQAQRQTDTNRRRSDAQMDTQRREAYNRQYRNKVDTERRQAGTLTSQNRSLNNQQIEADKQRRGYENQRRQAEQQMATNHAATDRRLYDVQQQARADSERRDMERKTATNSGQMEQRIAEDRNKPKNLFDRMGRAIGDAGNTITDAAKNVGNAVSDTYDNATSWLGDRAKDIGETVGGAARAASEGARNLFDTAGNAIGDVSDYVSDRARDAGNWIDRNVTGATAKQQMDASRDAWQKRKDLEDSLIDQGYSAANRNDMNRAGSILDKLNQPGNTEELFRQFNDARNSYDNSLAGRIDKYITGNTARDIANKYALRQENAERLRDSFNNQNQMATEREALPNYGRNDVSNGDGSGLSAANDALWSERGSRYYQQQADNSLAGRVGNAVRQVGEDTRNLFDTAGNAINDAAKNVGDWAGNRVNDVKNFGETVGRGMERGFDMLGQMTNNMVPDLAKGAYDWSKDAVNAGRNLFDTAGNAIGGVRDYVSSMPQRAADASGLTAGNNLTEAAQREDAARAARDQARSNYETRVNSNPELNLNVIQIGRNATARQLQQAEAAGNEVAANQLRRQLRIYDDALANPDKYARAIQNNVDPVSNYQQAYTDAAREHQLATMGTRAAQNAYDATPMGQIENLLSNIGIDKEDFRKWLATMGR